MEIHKWTVRKKGTMFFVFNFYFNKSKTIPKSNTQSKWKVMQTSGSRAASGRDDWVVGGEEGGSGSEEKAEAAHNLRNTFV